MESRFAGEMKDAIGMEKDEPYYNSGVLLMDLEAWRDQMPGQLLEFCYSHQGSLSVVIRIPNGALRGRTAAVARPV